MNTASHQIALAAAPRMEPDTVAQSLDDRAVKTPFEDEETGQCRQASTNISIPAQEPAQQDMWTATRVLNIVDSRILEACESRGKCEREIQIARDNISRLLRKRPLWYRPDAINADASSEIHIVWRSMYGKVEMDTDEKGDVEYYVTRTADDRMKEGRFATFDADEVERIMSWLDENPEVE